MINYQQYIYLDEKHQFSRLIQQKYLLWHHTKQQYEVSLDLDNRIEKLKLNCLFKFHTCNIWHSIICSSHMYAYMSDVVSSLEHHSYWYNCICHSRMRQAYAGSHFGWIYIFIYIYIGRYIEYIYTRYDTERIQ